MIPVDWNELVRHIGRSLPGLCLWMQCVPVRDDDSTTEEGVGLALQRLTEPGGRRYLVVFFSVLPDPGATGERGAFLPGRGERTADWAVEVGYEEPFDSLEEAVRETKWLARHLPMSGIYRTHERREAVLDQITDPDEDLEQSARYER